MNEFARRMLLAEPFTAALPAQASIESLHAEQLEQLLRLSDRVQAGSAGCTAVVCGKAGTGKTQLLERFRRAALRLQSGRVVSISLTDEATSDPLRSVAAAVLRRLVDAPGGDLRRTPLYRLVRAAVDRAIEQLPKRDTPHVVGEILAAFLSLVDQRFERLDVPCNDILRIGAALFRFTVLADRASRFDGGGRSLALTLRWLQSEPLTRQDEIRIGLCGVGARGKAASVVCRPSPEVLLGILAAVAALSRQTLVVCFDAIDACAPERLRHFVHAIDAMLRRTRNLMVVYSGEPAAVMATLREGESFRQARDAAGDDSSTVVLGSVSTASAKELLIARLRVALEPFLTIAVIRDNCERDPLFPLGGEWFAEHVADQTLSAGELLGAAAQRWTRQQDILREFGAAGWCGSDGRGPVVANPVQDVVESGVAFAAFDASAGTSACDGDAAAYTTPLVYDDADKASDIPDSAGMLAWESQSAVNKPAGAATPNSASVRGDKGRGIARAALLATAVVWIATAAVLCWRSVWPTTAQDAAARGSAPIGVDLERPATYTSPPMSQGPVAETTADAGRLSSDISARADASPTSPPTVPDAPLSDPTPTPNQPGAPAQPGPLLQPGPQNVNPAVSVAPQPAASPANPGEPLSENSAGAAVSAGVVPSNAASGRVLVPGTATNVRPTAQPANSAAPPPGVTPAANAAAMTATRFGWGPPMSPRGVSRTGALRPAPTSLKPIAVVANPQIDRMLTEAWGLIERGDAGPGRLRLMQARKLEPDDPRADFSLGLLDALVQNDWPAAEKRFADCVRRDPANVPSMNNLAVAQLQNRHESQAVRQWQAIASQKAAISEVVQNLGYVRAQLEQGKLRGGKSLLKIYDELYTEAAVATSSSADPLAGYRLMALALPDGSALGWNDARKMQCKPSTDSSPASRGAAASSRPAQAGGFGATGATPGTLPGSMAAGAPAVGLPNASFASRPMDPRARPPVLLPSSGGTTPSAGGFFPYAPTPSTGNRGGRRGY